jgi:hypothetical protein
MENALGAPKLLSLHILEEITDGFSKDRKLGGGAYGDVYMVRFMTLRMILYFYPHFYG